MAVLIGAGGPSDRAHLPLATRRRTTIPNEKRLERNPAALRAAVELWSEKHPSARLRSATAVYNCMGLVFASRRTWIDPIHLPIILRDDEYRQLAGPHEIQPGDIIVYRDKHDRGVSHVGVIVEIKPEIQTASRRITVMSQWGGDGEYLHLIDDVPDAYGKLIEYWTDRRPKP